MSNPFLMSDGEGDQPNPMSPMSGNQGDDGSIFSDGESSSSDMPVLEPAPIEKDKEISFHSSNSSNLDFLPNKRDVSIFRENRDSNAAQKLAELDELIQRAEIDLTTRHLSHSLSNFADCEWDDSGASDNASDISQDEPVRNHLGEVPDRSPSEGAARMYESYREAHDKIILKRAETEAAKQKEAEAAKNVPTRFLRRHSGWRAAASSNAKGDEVDMNIQEYCQQIILNAATPLSALEPGESKDVIEDEEKANQTPEPNAIQLSPEPTTSSTAPPAHFGMSGAPGGGEPDPEESEDDRPPNFDGPKDEWEHWFQDEDGSGRSKEPIITDLLPSQNISIDESVAEIAPEGEKDEVAERDGLPTEVADEQLSSAKKIEDAGEEESVDGLRAKLAETQSLLMEKSEQVEMLERRTAELAQEGDIRSATVKDEQRVQIESLRKENALLQDGLKTTQQGLGSTNAVRDENEKFRAQLLAKERELKEAEQTITEKDTEITVLREDLVESRRLHAENSDYFDFANSCNAVSERIISTRVERVLRDNVARLRTNNASNMKAITELERAMAKLEGETMMQEIELRKLRAYKEKHQESRAGVPPPFFQDAPDSDYERELAKCQPLTSDLNDPSP